MKMYFFILLTVFALSAQAQVNRLVLISIDGLHPNMYLDKSWPTPNLQELMKRGTFADYCLSVFPAYTYPSHTAMLTGAMPARSKVVYNQPMDDHSGNWNWYAKYNKAPVIWDALHRAGLKTAAVMWPGTVDGRIDYNISEIWDKDHPDDRATVVRKHATPEGIYEEIEKNATGKLDSSSMNDNYFSLDENTGRMAAYIFMKYRPAFMAVHFACVDGMEHENGRDADSVRLAVEADDQAIGHILEVIRQQNMTDSTTVVIVGDHGFSNIHTVMRPNMLIRNLPAKFVAAGGSCFLYIDKNANSNQSQSDIIKSVTDNLEKLPVDKRKLFRIVYRKELDKMGADSVALLALAAIPGIVFSNSITKANIVNYGPGTLIQQNTYDGLFFPTKGGHHGYDPNEKDMWTGFIAAGAGI
jgi:predicted AlkP superfamily pyrophosphatase or phosphodiesterase